LLQINFDHFLGVVPSSSSVCHKDGLIKSENRNRNQIANEKERLEESKSQGRKEHAQENIEHAFLRVLSADFDYLLTVRHRSFFDAFQFDVGFDEFNRSVSAGGNRLNRRAREPIDNRPTHNQPQHKGRVQQRKLLGTSG